MATKVYATLEIEALDGTELVLKPMEIKRKRKFFELMKRYTDVIGAFLELLTKEKRTRREEDMLKNYDDSAALNVMIEMVALSLQRDYPSLVEKNEDGEYAWIEENVDEETMYKIIEVCAGTNLKATPESQTAATEMIEAQAGTT